MPILKIISAGLGLAASFSLCHAAMTNEPTEFRGIGWGAPIEDHQKELVSLSSRGDVAFYRCPADQLSWGGAEIQKISYRYFRPLQRIDVAAIRREPQKSHHGKNVELYGPPEQPNKRVPQYFWTGEKAKVVLF